jgi:hypothetical protein
LKVDFQGSRVTSDGNLILVREMDERLGLNGLIGQHLTDQCGTNSRLPLANLFRQSVYSRLAGDEDVSNAEHLSQDPTFRLISAEKIWERDAALTSRLQSFETGLLVEERILAGLATINRELIAKAEAINSPQRIVLEWRALRFRFTANRSTAPTMDTSSPLATIRCCCSIGRVIVGRPSCSPATSTVATTGKNYYFLRSDELRFGLSVIAYSLGNLWRRLVLSRRIHACSLTSLQQRLVKTAGRLIKHARHYWLLLVEGPLTRRLFAAMLGRTTALPVPAG